MITTTFLDNTSESNKYSKNMNSPPPHRSLFSSNAWNIENGQQVVNTNDRRRENGNVTTSVMNGGSIGIETNTGPYHNNDKIEESGAFLPPPKDSLLMAFANKNATMDIREESTTNIHDSHNNKNNNSNNDNWVIVSGFIPSAHGQSIQSRFQSYGVILDQIIGKNYICLQYSTSIESSKALCQDWTFHHNQEIFIAVRRLSSSYDDLQALRRKSCNEMLFTNTTSTATATPFATDNTIDVDDSILLPSNKQQQPSESTMQGKNLQTNVNTVSASASKIGIMHKMLYGVFNW